MFKSKRSCHTNRQLYPTMLPPPCLDHLLANFFKSPIYMSNTWSSFMCPKWTSMPPFSSYINLYISFTSLLKSHTSLSLSLSLSQFIVNLTLFIPSYKTKPKANNKLSHPNKILKHIQSQLILSLTHKPFQVYHFHYS